MMRQGVIGRKKKKKSNPTGTHGLHSIHVSFIIYEVIGGLKHAAMCIL